MLAALQGRVDTSVSQIRPGLYLGGLSARLSVEKLGIDYILSVIKPIDYSGRDKASSKRMVIPVDDMADTNLLQHFPMCIAFIKQALAAESKILVHCAMGISRSCTVVAAYLMSIEGLPVDTALQELRQKRPMCRPNDGFLEQLHAFDVMNKKLLTQHPAYKKYHLQNLAEQWQENSTIDTSTLANPSDTAGQVLYRCRRCRRLISTQTEVMSASSGHQSDASASCLFVEPMQWMSEITSGHVQGKLYCPGCKTRIGSFNWAGMRSPTGAWVTPAFHLQLSKLDAQSTQEAHSSVQIRQPVFRSTPLQSK
ncbi:hypothetical protein WJX74_007792 [Apatococcus lobatus]|uniref:protein-tyrosine-phosphatase n=2 Tax=Apatococcus TaxID=904362 RepID=A0AAW1SKM5_9CHLO